MVEDILNDTGKLIFVAICFAIFMDVVIGLFMLVRQKKFKENALSTTASVVGKEYYNDVYQYTVEYKDRLGKAYTGKCSSGQSYSNGDEMEILYDKNNPEKVKPNNKFQLFILPFAMLFGSVMFGIILIVLVNMGIAKIPF